MPNVLSGHLLIFTDISHMRWDSTIPFPATPYTIFFKNVTQPTSVCNVKRHSPAVTGYITGSVAKNVTNEFCGYPHHPKVEISKKYNNSVYGICYNKVNILRWFDDYRYRCATHYGTGVLCTTVWACYGYKYKLCVDHLFRRS